MTSGLPNLPIEKLQKVLPPMAALFFVVLIGLELARLIWLLVPLPADADWQSRPAKVATATTKPANDGFDLNRLLAAQLFGQASRDEAPPPSDTVDAPDTNLRLTLRGIFAMDEAGRSRALIEPDNGELKPYAVGMDIPGGAKLHSIFADRVLLQRGPRLETLRLEKEKPGEGEVPISLAQRDSDASGAARILDSGTAAKLSEIRAELLNDPTKASEYLRVQPARRNGQLHGYRIYPGRNRELFKEAGLRPGDIVTSINGVNLDDPSKSLQLLGDLSQAQNLNLQVERGGRTQSMSVTLN